MRRQARLARQDRFSKSELAKVPILCSTEICSQPNYLAVHTIVFAVHQALLITQT